jgi:hypothetical protein
VLFGINGVSDVTLKVSITFLDPWMNAPSFKPGTLGLTLDISSNVSGSFSLSYFLLGLMNSVKMTLIDALTISDGSRFASLTL